MTEKDRDRAIKVSGAVILAVGGVLAAMVARPTRVDFGSPLNLVLQSIDDGSAADRERSLGATIEALQTIVNSTPDATVAPPTYTPYPTYTRLPLPTPYATYTPPPTQRARIVVASVATYTPYPTYTPLARPTLYPTYTSVPTQRTRMITATARPKEVVVTLPADLFSDSFESGIDPAWQMRGANYNSTQGHLWIEDGWVESKSFQNQQWQDISARLVKLLFHDTSSKLTLRLRVQDNNNYLMLSYQDFDSCAFVRVSRGEETAIPGTTVELPNDGDFAYSSEGVDLHVVVEGNEYRLFTAGKQRVRFVDDTFDAGGVVIRLEGSLTVDAIEIKSLN